MVPSSPTSSVELAALNRKVKTLEKENLDLNQKLSTSVVQVQDKTDGKGENLKLNEEIQRLTKHNRGKLSNFYTLSAISLLVLLF